MHADSEQHGGRRQDGASSRVFLLDGNNLAHRAFHALPDSIATSTGFPTNALYGFCTMVLKILSECEPAEVIVAWDSREKTFRHEEYDEYKAHRKPMPEPLSEQWPYFEELAEAFGFVNLRLEGYEADDVLATLARQADSLERDVVIVTGDRDILQLVSPHVTVMANTKGVTEVKLYDPETVEERYGIPPRLVPDFIGLKGDTSDNIPGVPGIGEKTAADLLAQFGTLEGVLEHIDEVSGQKRRQILEEHREDAVLSKKLARLDREAPISFEMAESTPRSADRGRLRELFQRFEFASLLDRLDQAVPPEEAEEETGEECVVEIASVSPARLEKALDWSRPVGLAEQAGEEQQVDGHETGEKGAVRLWMAQYPPGSGGPCAFELVDPTGLEGPLRTLLLRGGGVCHDVKATRFLRRIVGTGLHDTYLAAYLLAPGRRTYGLEDLLGEYGARRPRPSEKAEQGEVGEDLSAPARAAAVLDVAERQEEGLKERGMWQLFREVEVPLIRVLVDMEEAGVRLDVERLAETARQTRQEIEDLEERIQELAGTAFNLGSPQQLAQVLFEELGLPVQRKTKTGYSTDARTLETLRSHHPVVPLIERYRELAKLESTYISALPEAVDPETGRLHTTFHQAVTATGRLSSSHPNLQNIPVRTPLGTKIRECFVADEGTRLIVADYSQIELRIMAHLSQEPTLLEAFAQGEDIHARTAAEVFDLAPEDVDATHRRYAKAVNFGIMYGISPFGLSQQLGTEREEAAAYITRYFERMPRVKDFIDATIADARDNGYVCTMFGRRRPITEIRSGNHQTRQLGERLAVNSVIQGSAADIIKVAMIRCHDRLAAEVPGARLLLQVHDELVFEAPEASAEATKELGVVEMERAYPMEPPLAVDAGIGQNWVEAK